MAIQRKRDARDFAGDHDKRSGAQKPFASVVLIPRFPEFGFAGGGSGVVKQSSEFSGAALGQTPTPDPLARVLRTGIETEEGDEGIAVSKRYPLEETEQACSDLRADADDGLQAPVSGLTLGLPRHQAFEFRIDAGDQLIQVLQKGVQVCLKIGHPLQGLPERSLNGHPLGTPLDEPCQATLLGSWGACRGSSTGVHVRQNGRSNGHLPDRSYPVAPWPSHHGAYPWDSTETR